MKKLSEIKDDTYLVVDPLNYDAIVMDKYEFIGSHWYLDKELVKVSLAKETYAIFNLYNALEYISDDMHEDWLSNVMDSIPTEVRERIEKEINEYLKKEPTYYPGEEIDLENRDLVEEKL